MCLYTKKTVYNTSFIGYNLELILVQKQICLLTKSFYAKLGILFTVLVVSYWSAWSQWTACSQPCGGGERTKYRTCETSYKNTHGNGVATECNGPTTVTRPCNIQCCRG